MNILSSKELFLTIFHGKCVKFELCVFMDSPVPQSSKFPIFLRELNRIVKNVKRCRIAGCDAANGCPRSGFNGGDCTFFSSVAVSKIQNSSIDADDCQSSETYIEVESLKLKVAKAWSASRA